MHSLSQASPSVLVICGSEVAPVQLCVLGGTTALEGGLGSRYLRLHRRRPTGCALVIEPAISFRLIWWCMPGAVRDMSTACATRWCKSVGVMLEVLRNLLTNGS